MKMLLFIFCVIFLNPEAIFSSNIQNCFSEDIFSHCCQVSWSDEAPLKPCGCKGKTHEQCHDNSLSSNCQWRANSSIENDCASLVNASKCFLNSDCNWMEDFSGNFFCFPLLCEDKLCSSLLNSDNNSNDCDLRPDCLWLNRSSECSSNLNCSCANPDELQTYCPCLKTLSLCALQEGCFWNGQDGCSNQESVHSNASVPALSSTIIFLSFLVMLGFY